MKKLLLGLVLLLSTLSFSQEHILTLASSVEDRDSITNSLNTRGYVKYGEDNGFYVNTSSDKSYCLNNSAMGREVVNRKSFIEKITLWDSIYNAPKIKVDKVKTPISYYLYSTDKFTGEKTYYSSLLSPISISKYVTKNSSSQYISLKVNGSTLNYGCYGISILFDNGKKIIRPYEKVKTDYSSGSGWEYSAFFRPTQNEINIFKSYKIVAVKLYIYDTDIESSDADNFLEAADVMLTSLPKNKK